MSDSEAVRAFSRALNSAMASSDGAGVEALIRGCPDAAVFTCETAIPIDRVQWSTTDETLFRMRFHYVNSSMHLAGSPVTMALAFGRPGWAEMMLDAGAYESRAVSPDVQPLLVAAGGWGRIQCRRPSWAPIARRDVLVKQLEVFRRLVSLLAPQFNERHRLRLRAACGVVCRSLIDAGESEMGFLAELLAAWHEPECLAIAGSSSLGCDAKPSHLSSLVPYREYAARRGRGAKRLVRWLGAGACRAAWIGAVVRAALAAPRR